jgi:hypothetical protein
MPESFGHRYMVLRCQGVEYWANNPIPKKTNYYESRKKTERINTMMTNGKRIKDLRMAIGWMATDDDLNGVVVSNADC